MIETPEQRIVDEAITSRHSIRAFLPTPVAREDIERMLDVAARAPSGSNIQPWKVYVLTGERKQRLSDAVTAAFMIRTTRRFTRRNTATTLTPGHRHSLTGGAKWASTCIACLDSDATTRPVCKPSTRATITTLMLRSA